MPCEEYREALSAAAVAGDTYELSTPLRVHLDACSACRGFFAEEQRLFAAIDAGIRRTANVEVPASLLPRVRLNIETAPNVRSRWMPMLVFASAGLVVAITIFAVLRSGRNAAEDPDKQIAAAPVREVSPVTPDPSQTPHPAGTIPALHSSRPRPGKNSSARQSASFGRFEVIVPADERDALARFIAARQEESDFAALLVDPTLDRVDKPLSVSPLEIADLEVRPLNRLGGEIPDSRNENR